MKCIGTAFGYICRVGQNHIYTVYIRYYWQGNHEIYGHIRCIYTVLANPNHLIAGMVSHDSALSGVGVATAVKLGVTHTHTHTHIHTHLLL